MKTSLLVSLVVSFIFISGCVQQIKQDIAEFPITSEEEPQRETIPSASPTVGLGNLCSDEEKCLDFCLNNRGRCEEYCKGNQNGLCKKIFPPGSDEQSKQQSQAMPSQSQEVCSGKGSVNFISPPMRIEEIELISPIGQMIGGHVTPIDHGYYTAVGWKPEYKDDSTKYKEILSPADGVVKDIGHMPGAKEGEDYRLVIYHTCTFYTIYIHLWKLSPELSQALGSSSYKFVNVPVQSGEVIGRSGGFDFSVHDEEITLPGFIVPEHYDAESWKIHTVDMFEYFVEPIRSQLLAKNVRQKEPRGGKIDYDVDGRLVGTWFVENSGGYRGGGVVADYWTTHLSFAYDGIEPSLVIVSIGDYDGEASQFAVKGNAPNPADVSVSSGLIKYELVAIGYLTEEGKDWNRMSFAKITKAYGFDQHVGGVALVQMIEDRKIKFETFPRKTASQVSRFTENAKIYER